MNSVPANQPLLARLAHVIMRRRLFSETPAELPFRLAKSTPVGGDGVTILVYQPSTHERPEA